jgi:c-di-GMP-binding flagellar brake protein YcgR
MLGFTRPRQDPTDEPEDPALAADVEAIVADPAEIARTLGEVNRAHCLLHVAREGSANTHVSVLLEVDQEAAHVLIDELSTAAVDAGTRLEVSTQLGGILIRFASTMREHARDRQGGYYRLDFPHHMQRVQRRAYHRVTVARDLGIRVVLAQDETTYEGEILDISVGGISLTLPGQPAWQDPGGPMQCTLHLQDGESMSCLFEPRRSVMRGDSLALAGRFTEVGPREDHALHRLIAVLDRELVKKRPR